MENITKVTLLCTSDIHGYYMPWDYSADKESELGGLTRVSTIYKQIKKDNPNTIIIDNGDLIQGNNAEYFMDREEFPGIKAINKIGYEIYNMGNHEFNFGMPKLIHVISQFNGVAMMGNLYRKKNTMRFMNGVYYKNIGNIRIGFISLNTPLVRRFEAKRGNLKNFDVIDADFELSKLLKDVGECDALIGLFHMGDVNENDIENTGVIDLLNNVEGADKIDAVFGGHMHQIKNYKINNTIFLEPGLHGEAISRLDLYFDQNRPDKLIEIKPSIIIVDDSIESDPEIEEVIKQSHNELRERINEFIGYVSDDLTEKDSIEGIPEILVRQTNLSEFYIDMISNYTDADVIAVHFDNPYAEVYKGEVRRKHINSSYAYSGGEISVFKITGNQLMRYLEWNAEYFNKSNVGDVNISFNPERIKYKYITYDILGNIYFDIDIRENNGNRIKNLRFLDGSEIDSEKIYKIAINKYRMDQLLSKHGPLAGENIKSIYSTLGDESLGVRGTIRNLAMKYISELPDKTYHPKTRIRWNILTNDLYKDYIDIAIDLVNEASLELYKTKNGKIDLSKSLNIFDELEEYQLDKLKEKYYINPETKILKEIIDEIKENYEI